MKDLLYLKDDHLKEFIEKLFVSYRESFNDAKKTLDKHSFCRQKSQISWKVIGWTSIKAC